jgi:Nuclease-related domain
MQIALWGGGAVLCAALLGLAVWAWQRRRERRRRLGQLIASIAANSQRDVLIPDGADGWYHVDFLLRTVAGILVLDVRDVSGAVFGGEHLDEWTVMDGSQRRTFPNPLESLYDRVAAVRAIVGDDVPVEGHVVLLSRARFATAAPPRTWLLEQIPDIAPPAAEIGEAYAEAWLALSTRTTPTPAALRRTS